MKTPIVEHRVTWEEVLSKKVEMVIGKDGVLSPCELQLWVRQEMNQEKPRNLGVLNINLAEYVREGLTTHRYLLQESKSNSTIKITLRMKQTDGDDKYKTPPLTKQQLTSAMPDISRRTKPARLKTRKLMCQVHILK
ncbi:hypothetical protein IWQ60_006938 [Tieghemiomyces parasiticus]|uniref:C2 NT-type domain-containing protein n=1 Tax=Tieghemiomyces parasiticus TaxID=78921 RepID=A0A9W8AA84_9FUNG|nr:hypothetical protein IWQ60_006938 [Tieghemiomyces parasiticus]